MTRRAVGGGEQDTFSRYWRPRTKYLSRPGMTSFYKRKARRRERREATASIAEFI